ncbi:GNAT family N-acetyltransferase [Anaerolentibacter hominis]|uniref:GNAT family N-acetyltransferase n=1 Tax=Anaerolentibacter hominis TaxID=3079009 RepID=UPI0031B861B6
MIRRAEMNDLPAIMKLIEETVTIMEKEGNTQWGPAYPLESDFREDILSGSLWVYETAEILAGVVCINQAASQKYDRISWKLPAPALIIHRMAVSPAVRRCGIGTALLNFAERQAAASGIATLRTDTFCKNPGMNSLFQRTGFSLAGSLYSELKQGEFYYYEKPVQRDADNH